MATEIPEGHCACGQPLHYKSEVSKEFTERAIKREGDFVDISIPTGTYRVQRHYVALHGIKAKELAEIAEKYGFEKVE